MTDEPWYLANPTWATVLDTLSVDGVDAPFVRSTLLAAGASITLTGERQGCTIDVVADGATVTIQAVTMMTNTAPQAPESPG